jgi:hypothetical protein
MIQPLFGLILKLARIYWRTLYHLLVACGASPSSTLPPHRTCHGEQLVMDPGNFLGRGGVNYKAIST